MTWDRRAWAVGDKSFEALLQGIRCSSVHSADALRQALFLLDPRPKLDACWGSLSNQRVQVAETKLRAVHSTQMSCSLRAFIRCSSLAGRDENLGVCMSKDLAGESEEGLG